MFCQVLPLPCSPLSPCGEENKEIAAWHFSVIKPSTQQSTASSRKHYTTFSTVLKSVGTTTLHSTNSAVFFTSVLLNIVKNCFKCSVQCSAVHYGAVQYSAVQCSAVQCKAVQCSAVQCITVQYIAVQYSAVHYGAVQYSAMQCSGVQ